MSHPADTAIVHARAALRRIEAVADFTPQERERIAAPLRFAIVELEASLAAEDAAQRRVDAAWTLHVDAGRLVTAGGVAA